MSEGEWAAELEQAASSTLATQADHVTRLVAAWLLGFASEHTRRSYAGDVANWRQFCADHDVDPLEASRPHVDAWARTLQEQGLKPRSLGRRLAAVSSWYRFLVTEEILQATPTEHVRRPKISDEGETPGLTRDELRRLLRAAVDHGSLRSVALLSLLAHTGLRVGEALSRDVEHLSHDRGHRILRLERKGGRGGRTVLTAPVVRVLDEYLAGRDTGPVFITKTGQRMGQPEAWRMVRR